MKMLLIHNDNVFLGDASCLTIKFLTTSSNIDANIVTSIIKPMMTVEYDVVYIKDNLSKNYIDLLGLRVAYHIRLSQELGDKRYVPIVILSDLNTDVLSRIDPMAQILFTKNIFTIANKAESIEKFQATFKLNPISEPEYRNNFLKRIHIEAPRETQHDIANEWAIDKWASFLKVSKDAVKTNREKIGSSLYFKYIMAKNPMDESKAIGYKRPKLSGKVLYVDDECDKGWKDIFDTYFSTNGVIKFNALGSEFKDSNKFSIIAEIVEKCKKYGPDVVLLDLRLASKDHDVNRKIENFTGIDALKKIKEINPGIQVIMFTATSNSLVLEQLYEYGVLGYIKKEHPEDKNINTKNNLNKLSDLIDQGLENKYLKEVWTISQDIFTLNILQEEKFMPMKFEINSIFEILDSDMSKRNTYAMLSIFQALEEINNYYINDKTKKWEDEHTETSIEDPGYTKQKIVAVLKRLKLINNFSSDIDKISKMRKKAIHPPKGKYEKPTKDNILTWLKMLQAILLKIDEKI